MFYSLDFLRTSSLGGGLSDCSDRLLWRGKAGARVYRSFCDKDQVAGISKDYCSFKKTRHLKFKNSVLVYVWEDARLWVHWNHTFDVHLSSLWPASCSFLSQVPSGLTVRAAAVASRLWHSLFTEMTGGIFHSQSEIQISLAFCIFIW